MFNNPNYAGCIFSSVFPFFFAAFRNHQISKKDRVVLFIFNITLVYGTLLTASRNAFLGLFIGLIICLIPIGYKFSLGVFSFIFFLFLSNFFFKEFLEIKIFPSFLFEKYEFQNLLNDPRIEIWKNSIAYIFQNPFLGWGGNNFSNIWNQLNSTYYGHSHNLFLELSIQYGLITSIVLFAMILSLIVFSFKEIFLENGKKFKIFSQDTNFDRAWFASLIVILFSNLIDIQYFDFRVSVLIWILLAGIKNIVDKDLKTENIN